ncbi:glycosyltransferase family 22 protein [Collybia nuda]|uniref:Mannosyltransferase n=1 Tax=Collybia nuda TaxID=64659 RepID=A0A9P5YI10_9AGAR|nr:glycosyltransferase family 22 protein [Collybia nuda]
MEITTTHLSICLRILIALCTRTFFQPDEFFQSLEPAHHLVFGYGHLTWEWLSPTPIRSIIYPALNVPIYWLLKLTGISDMKVLGSWLLIACPKIMHGVFAAATDIWLCRLTRQVLGRQYVSTALFLSLSCFFNVLSLSRSLSNSLETSLTTIAFSYYPWDASSNLSPQLIFYKPRMRKTLIFAALACMVRPTNIIIWIYLFGNIFWSLRSHKRAVNAVFYEGMVVGAIAGIVQLTSDSLYYRKLTLTPLNFFLTNMSSVSLFYGSSPWHYYLTQGIPILCTTALPFMLLGIYSTVFNRGPVALRSMLGTVMWTVGIYSIAGHKEWRFIHPILPLLHVFAAKALVDLSNPAPGRKGKPKKSRKSPQPHTIFNKLPSIRPAFLALLLLTLPASIYIMLFYCSGPVSVLSYIRSIPHVQLGNETVGFLMPCHSTPGHAYLHQEKLAQGAMWALGCEPPLEFVHIPVPRHPYPTDYILSRKQELSTYLDQTDVFFQSPQNYLQKYFPPKVNLSFPFSLYPASIPGTAEKLDGYPWEHEWPRYLGFFGALLREEGVESMLVAKGYKEVWRGGREWEGEGHRKGAVRVWKWSK